MKCDEIDEGHYVALYKQLHDYCCWSYTVAVLHTCHILLFRETMMSLTVYRTKQLVPSLSRLQEILEKRTMCFLMYAFLRISCTMMYLSKIIIIQQY